MKTNNREILIYYHPESSSDKKTIAHAKSLTPHVRSYAYGSTPSTLTSWQMIISALDVHPKQLLNKAHPFYQKNLRGAEFDNSSWLKVIANNPQLIKAAIAIRGKKAVLCTNPTDVLQLNGDQRSGGERKSR